MGERIPVTYRLARAAMLAAILVAALAVLLLWAADAVDLAQRWLAAVDRWYDRTTPW